MKLPSYPGGGGPEESAVHAQDATGHNADTQHENRRPDDLPERQIDFERHPASLSSTDLPECPAPRPIGCGSASDAPGRRAMAADDTDAPSRATGELADTTAPPRGHLVQARSPTRPRPRPHGEADQDAPAVSGQSDKSGRSRAPAVRRSTDRRSGTAMVDSGSGSAAQGRGRRAAGRRLRRGRQPAGDGQQAVPRPADGRADRLRRRAHPDRLDRAADRLVRRRWRGGIAEGRAGRDGRRAVRRRRCCGSPSSGCSR